MKKTRFTDEQMVAILREADANDRESDFIMAGEPAVTVAAWQRRLAHDRGRLRSHVVHVRREEWRRRNR